MCDGWEENSFMGLPKDRIRAGRRVMEREVPPRENHYNAVSPRSPRPNLTDASKEKNERKRM